MSRVDGFTVMDVEAGIVHDGKWKRLARYAPDRVATAGWVYIATMGESWHAGRRVSAEDAWPAYIPFDPLVIEGMVHVGLLDAKGRIVSRTWRSWFERARERREKTREQWREWQRNHRARQGDVNPDSDPDKGKPSVPSVLNRRERTSKGVQQPTDIAREAAPWSSWAAADLSSERAS